MDPVVIAVGVTAILILIFMLLDAWDVVFKLAGLLFIAFVLCLPFAAAAKYLFFD